MRYLVLDFTVDRGPEVNTNLKAWFKNSKLKVVQGMEKRRTESQAHLRGMSIHAASDARVPPIAPS